MGDPTAIGWLATVCYFALACLCFSAASASAGPGRSTLALRVRRFWLIAGVLLAALGVSKQLDLQIMLAEIGRSLAKGEGWYHGRREVQGLLMLALAIVGGGAVALVGYLVRAALCRMGLALVGMVLLVGLFLVRAASFHPADLFLDQRVGQVQMTLAHGLELTGMVCVAASAALAKFWQRRKTGGSIRNPTR